MEEEEEEEEVVVVEEEVRLYLHEYAHATGIRRGGATRR